MAVYKEKSAPKEAAETEIDDLPVQIETNSDIEDLLNDIDEILEENAQEFVQGYVQKGGQ